MSLNIDKQSYIGKITYAAHAQQSLFITSCEDVTIIEFALYFTDSDGYNALP